MGFAVELERRVIGDHGVMGELRGDQVRIHGSLVGRDAARHGRVKTAPHARQTSGRKVLGEQIVGRTRATASRRTGDHELLVGKHGASLEEVG
jgi:hypothetical protein